jgi:glutamyl-tRNA synthetase
MNVVTRFAPSPTGRLHLGNARTAVLNWLFARSEGGRVILRMDDTDAARSRPEFAEAIVDDLFWLGLVPDETARQSARLARYAEAAERLKVAGRLYPAYETEEELEKKRKRQLLRGMPPVYDREALDLSPADRARLEGEGRPPHWRFRLDQREVAWSDAVRGAQTIDAASLSDPVLIRGDGSVLYTLSSVADDIEMAVTHVIRGEDHVANTAPQIQIFEALGAQAPVFAHHSLLVGAEGGRLSKRERALSLADLKARHIEPMTVVSLCATIGTSSPIAVYQELDDAFAGFDLDRLSRAPARFDPEELGHLNAKLLKGRPFEAVRQRLAALGVGGGAAFWLAVRDNVEVVDDAARWWAIATQPIDPVLEEDAAYCTAAAKLLPRSEFGPQTWGEWTAALAEATNRKGRLLYKPLRLALTGEARGPDLASFLPFIGRERAFARLRGGRA